jgi:hypothetical protein
MVYQWYAIGIPMVYQWYTIGIPMVYHWYTNLEDHACNHTQVLER